MKLPSTYFQSSFSQRRIVSNLIYFALKKTDQYKDQQNDFASRRFNLIRELLSSRKKFTEDSIEKLFFQEELNEDANFDQYMSTLVRLYNDTDKRVLDRLYAGETINEIQTNENLSFDQLNTSFRMIELLFNQSIIDDPRIKYKNQEALDESDREILSLMSIGVFDYDDISLYTGISRAGVSNKAMSAIGKASLSKAQLERRARSLDSFNFERNHEIPLRRLFDLIDDQDLKQKILIHNDDDLMKSALFISDFRVHLSRAQRVVLRAKLWGFTKKQIERELAKRALNTDSQAISYAFESAKEKLEKKMRDFFSSKCPLGIDRIKFLSLEPRQKSFLNDYMDGKDLQELKSKYGFKTRANKNGLLRTIAKSLGITRAEIDRLKPKAIQSKQDLVVDVLPKIFSTEKIEKLSLSEKLALVRRMKMIIATVKKLRSKNLGRFTDPKYFEDHYFKALETGQIAKKYNLPTERVITHIKTFKNILIKALSNKTELPKGFDEGIWSLFTDKQRKTYRAFIETGGDYAQMSKRDDFKAKSSALKSRMKTIERMIASKTNQSV